MWDALIEDGHAVRHHAGGDARRSTWRGSRPACCCIDVDYVSARQALIEAAEVHAATSSASRWTVALDKAAVRRHEALIAPKRRAGRRGGSSGSRSTGSRWKRCIAELGLAAASCRRTAWRTSVPIYVADSDSRSATRSSGCWSPLLKRYIALAHLEAAYAAPGTRARDGDHGRASPQAGASARVAKLPFFNPERKRA